ncbi:MAG: hypothetical protein WCQ99_13240 [Pseudomonadota bacterium]
MAKLVIPTLTDQRKSGLAKQNIRIRENSTLEELEHSATEYLTEHNMLHLATCSNNNNNKVDVHHRRKT